MLGSCYSFFHPCCFSSDQSMTDEGHHSAIRKFITTIKFRLKIRQLVQNDIFNCWMQLGVSTYKT